MATATKHIPYPDIEVQNKSNWTNNVQSNDLELPSKMLLQCYYTNADSLLNKKRELESRLFVNDIDLCAITEVLTKQTLNSKIKAKDMSISGYNLFSNIDSTNHRGVALYLSNKVKATELPHICTDSSVESVVVEFQLENKERVLCAVIYRSPSENNHSALRNFLKEIMSKDQYQHILFMGDFNYPEINWESHHTNTSDIHPEFLFLKVVNDCYLSQHIQDPTRYRQNQTSNCLDLVFTDNENSIEKLTYEDPLGASDHIVVSFNYVLHSESVHNNYDKSNRYSYNKGDYAKLRETLNGVDWDREFQGLDTEEMLHCLHTKMMQAVEECVPKQIISNRNQKYKRPLWLNKKILRSIKKKRNAYKTWLLTKHGKDYERYKKINNSTKSSVRKQIRNFEADIANNSKNNCKIFWRYVNSKLKTKIKVPDLKTDQHNTTTSEQEKANLLNNFFKSVFSKADIPEVTDRDVEWQFLGLPLTDIQFTEEKVRNLLSDLNTSKAAGPDDIHPRILKELSNEIAYPIFLIFQSSFSCSHVPEVWKLANVSPIHKKGAKNKKENYRPISLTSIVCRIMEKLIKEAIVDHFLTNNLFSPDQYGFRQFRSCLLQLLEALEDWTSYLDKGDHIDVIYFDFSKAFDSVSHKLLLTKLKEYGITGKLYDWIANFLKNRRQRVVLNGCKSDWVKVTSGVPQGSVLGPLLFLIFVNDLPRHTNFCKIKMFADDIKLYSKAKDNHARIQYDISKVCDWSKKWHLPLNSQKCKELRLGISKDSAEAYILSSRDDTETNISRVEEMKDLGVVMDSKLKFDQHIAEISKKATGVLASIKRTLTYIDRNVFVGLYKSLVRPLLETSVSVWNPYMVKHIKQLEAVQRRATKLVRDIRQLSYNKRLQALKLPTLQYRRKRGDMITTYKIFHGLIDTDPSKFFKINDNKTRGHKYKIVLNKCRLDVRKNFYSQRIIKEWNCLPADIVEAKNAITFEKLFDRLHGDSKYEFKLN